MAAAAARGPESVEQPALLGTFISERQKRLEAVKREGVNQKTQQVAQQIFREAQSKIGQIDFSLARQALVIEALTEQVSQDPTLETALHFKIAEQDQLAQGKAELEEFLRTLAPHVPQFSDSETQTELKTADADAQTEHEKRHEGKVMVVRSSEKVSRRKKKEVEDRGVNNQAVLVAATALATLGLSIAIPYIARRLGLLA